MANEHGKLIATAAKAALAPIGCIRKGQSRVWYSDQRFWVISVEFQPSGWSKGSYLNIGVSWLWSGGKGAGLFYRPTNFISFESKEQFTPLIEEMAQCAANEVTKLRERFNSLEQIQRYLLTDQRRGGGPLLNAAIASQLLGETALAKQFFRRIDDWPIDGYDWQKNIKMFSAKLNEEVDHPDNFRATILSVIQQARQSIDLMPDPHCLDDVRDSTAAR